jgi:hypothetical protein
VRKRYLNVALLFCAATAASLVAGSSQPEAAPTQGIRAVPSLEPAATQRLWRQVVRRRAARTFAGTPNCRPLRAVFYAPTDWLRLATKLAASASPCAEYFISIPPLAGAKTTFRPDQAWRIRALGPSFHALAEVNASAWRAWIAANNSTWYAAGVEARRRMAAAGFSVALGDDWIVNEFSSAVRRGLGSARTEMRDFVHGLHDGDGSEPMVKGGVFNIGLGQGLSDPSAYKSQLASWLQDDGFWRDLSLYVNDWSQELYGDPRNYAVGGSSPAARIDHLSDYFRHQLVQARLGGDATESARSFLENADSPLANAAWQWGSGFGWTMIPADQMKDYVSAQVYALRHDGAVDGQPEDRWGFAWAPRNGAGMSAADFKSRSGEVIDRLAAAIRDSGQLADSGDAGFGACGPAGQNLWCGSAIAGAWFNDAWKIFSYWGRLDLAFATPARTLSAGSLAGPIVVQTRLAGSVRSTPNAIAVTLASSSARGVFSTSKSGPWTRTLNVTIRAGSASSPTVYYADTSMGSPVLTAVAAGADGATQTATVSGHTAIRRSVPLVECVVPSLRGKTLVAAERTLQLRHCALGRVRGAYTHRASRGRVAFQSAPAGEHRGRNAQIDVTVSRGRR